MWTGRQTLTSIEQGISRLNAQEGQLDVALRQAAAEAERLRRERAEALRELARVKLGEMEAGRLLVDLDAGERRALQIMADRRDRMTALGEQRTIVLAELDKAEATRDEAASRVEAALDAVTSARAVAAERVRATSDWIAANATFAAADAIAGEAEKKAELSEEELQGKRRPYDNDPLFVYLWQRGYGTAAYRAGRIVHMVDKEVASFIGFLDARPNYAMLTEIPRRLREHAAERRRAAEKEHAALAAIETRAMQAAGVDDLERALAEARHRLAVADEAAEQKRARLQQLDEQRDALQQAGEDETYRAAVESMVSADSTDTIATLLAEAKRTATEADERIVNRLAALEERIAAADKEAADLRTSAKEFADRRTELERARRDLRRSGYDHPDVTFGNDNAIGEAIEQVVKGVVRSGILWDLLRAGYGLKQRRTDRGFGTPSWPFPFPLPGGGDGPRGGDWRSPSSSGGWSPGRRDDDDDGFTTGGSF